MQSVGEKIKQRRKELGLSQRDLADIIGYSHMQISRYETNSNDPTARAIILLARALDVSADWLLDLEQRKQPSKIDEQERELLRLYHAQNPDLQKKLIEIARVL